jgi:hypothetical protein
MSNNVHQNTTEKTKDWASPAPLKTGGKLKCSGSVTSSCSSSETGTAYPHWLPSLICTTKIEIYDSLMHDMRLILLKIGSMSTWDSLVWHLSCFFVYITTDNVFLLFQSSCFSDFYTKHLLFGITWSLFPRKFMKCNFVIVVPICRIGFRSFLLFI